MKGRFQGNGISLCQRGQSAVKGDTVLYVQMVVCVRELLLSMLPPTPKDPRVFEIEMHERHLQLHQ